MSFLYISNKVLYDGLYLGEHVVWPVIYIKDYQKNWAWVHTDCIKCKKCKIIDQNQCF